MPPIPLAKDGKFYPPKSYSVQFEVQKSTVLFLDYNGIWIRQK
jgi:hypothetical protein